MNTLTWKSGWRTIALLLVVVINAGCGWRMPLPSQKLRCEELDPAEQRPQGIIRRVSTLELPGSHERRWSFDSFHVVREGPLLSTTISRWISDQYEEHVVLWNMETGRIIMMVNPASPLPEGIRSNPNAVALSTDASTLVTCRAQVMQIWRVPDGTQICSFEFGASPIIRNVEIIDGKPVYRTYPAERPRDAVLTPDGSRLTAWISSEEAWLTWDTATGDVVDRRPDSRPEPPRPNLAKCGEITLSRDLILQTADRRMRLLPKNIRVASGVHAMFSPNCGLLLVRFFAPGSKLDFTPDRTLPHTRVWDTHSGEFVAWINHSDADVPWRHWPLGFLDESRILVRGDGHERRVSQRLRCACTA